MTRLSIAALRRQARGQWGHVLASLGVPDSFLTKRNGPCPVCGGRDRFAFTDKDGSGSFVCRSHHRQGGDGFELVRHVLGCDLPQALDAVAGAIGVVPGQAPPPLRIASPPVAGPGKDRGAALRRVWQAARPVQAGDPVALYLQSRGIALDAYPGVLRYHPALPYWYGSDGRPINLGEYPAMLAAVQAPDGKTVALHRTYLTPDGAKAQPVCRATGESLPAKKLMARADGVMHGAAIRLAQATTRLAIAEGIETALAVQLIAGVPVWSCVSAFGMETVAVPEHVTEVFVAADNDASGIGQQAAQRLAQRLSAEGKTATVIYPTSEGADWLDVLRVAD